MVKVFIVAGPNQGKTTIASIFKEALVNYGIRKVIVVDESPPAVNKQPIEQRMAATMERPVNIEVVNSQNQRSHIPTVLARHWLQAVENARAQIKTLGSPTDSVQEAHIKELDETISDLKVFIG